MTTSFHGDMDAVGSKEEKNPPMPSQFARRLTLQSNTGEEAQAFLSSIYVPLRIAAQTRDPVDLETQAVHCGGLGFSTNTSHSGLRFIFDEPFDGYGMSIPLTGSMSVEAGAGDPTRSRVNGGLMMDSLTVDAATFAARSTWQRITVDTETLHERLATLTERPVHHRVRFDPHFRMDHGACGLIMSISRAIIEGTRGDAPLLSAPLAMANLRESVLWSFVEAMPHSQSPHLNRPVAAPAPRQLRRAIEFMHANVLLPIRLEDVASASQVSVRSLQLAFRRFRNTTPMEYLRHLRLEGARSELLRGVPGATVAAVAYRWGFSHHGVFSRRYARLFGESPSTTLRNHREGPATPATPAARTVVVPGRA